MKKIFALVLIIINANMILAQKIENSSGTKYKGHDSKFDIHKVLVGGNLGLGGSGNPVSGSVGQFNIAPALGYRITNALHAGIELNYTYIRYRLANVTDFNTGNTHTLIGKFPIYSFGPWARLLIGRSIFAHTSFSLAWYKIQDQNQSFYLKNNRLYIPTLTKFGPSFIVGAGYANQLGNNSYYAISINYDLLQDPNSLYYSGKDLISGLFYKVGYYISL